MVSLFVGGQEWFDTYFQHLLAPLLFYFLASYGQPYITSHADYFQD